MRRFGLFVAAFVMMISSLASIALPQSASANGRGIDRGFFFDQARTDNKNVLEDGVPYWINDKEAFINYILDRWYNSARYGSCPGNGCDFAGAGYIIQTMRGTDGAGNWDHGYPDNGDIDDWRNKIRQPNIGMRWGSEGWRAGGITSDRFKNGADRDIAQTYGNTSGDTLVFYNTQNGDVYYILRQICANPLGQFPGLPNIPVAVDYDLTPRVSFNGSLTMNTEAGASGIQVGYDVNAGGSVTSRPTNWQLTRCVFAPGSPASAYGTEGDNTSDGRATYAANGGACGSSQAGNQQFSIGTTNLGALSNESVGNAPPGARVCYILSVSPPNETAATNVWRHSTPACILVIKFPKVQVLGGDLRASTVSTRPATNINGKFYGSWSEFGIFGVSGITGMGSAASFAGGGSTGAGTELTFANTPSTGNFYSVAPSPNKYFDAYKDQATETTTGSTTRGGVPDAHAIVHVTGNLTINSDIAYNGSYATVADVPRVIYVVDGNITVNANVGRIDAWLISKGTLYTCSDYTGTQKLSTGVCNKQLTFNGPVTVNDTVLGRTYGADVASDLGQPAEVFNLNPSNYLSNYSASVSSGTIQTVYEKELPPRW